MARDAGDSLEKNHRCNASEEQALVARGLDQNLVNIRDLSTQSPAGANQTTAASREPSRLAVELATLIKRFQI